MANTLKYTDGTGPAFVDGTTGKTATFNAQSLSADRAYTLPNATGTLSLTSDLSAYALLAGPHFTGVPLSTTPAADDNSTKIATTAFVMAEIPRFYTSPTAGSIINGDSVVIASVDYAINPFVYVAAGTLATLGLTLPDGIFDGQIIYVSINHIITALTMGGTNLEGTNTLAQPTSWALNQCVGWSWNAANSKWVRFQ